MTSAGLRSARGAVLVILLLVAPASGQSLETGSDFSGAVDTVHVSWQVDRLSGAAGSGGSLDLVHAVTGGPTYTFGGAAFGVGESRWGFGRLGVVVRPTTRLFAEGGARVGRGTEAGAGFRYLSLRGRVGYRLNRRVTVSVDDEYLDVAETHGQLVKLGSQLLVSSSASVSASYATSLGGNLNTTFAQGRLDVLRGRFRVFGGGAAGRTTPGVVDIGLGVRAPNQAMRQGYVGAMVPVGPSRLTLILDRLALDRASRVTFTVSLSLGV